VPSIKPKSTTIVTGFVKLIDISAGEKKPKKVNPFVGSKPVDTSGSKPKDSTSPTCVQIPFCHSRLTSLALNL